jgi:RsiW-degrading membrane proteinase PrsW (M82 family)
VTTFNPRLLTPPQQEEEIYPYRRVWQSVVIEAAVLFGVTLFLYVLTNILKISIPPGYYAAIALVLALLPVMLWLYFSWWRERSVSQPRERLLTVAVITALAANAVGVPLANEFLQVDQWLPLSSAVNRIIGYTFTVGIVQGIIKYLVLRYSAWPDCFRVRLDSVAYGAATGIGYASVLNMQFVFSDNPAPDVAAARIFANVALHVGTGMLIGYGLAELWIGTPTPVFPVYTLALSSLITGIAIPIRAGLVNATLGLGISSTRPLLGIIFSAVLFILPAFTLSFFIDNADRQTREAAASREN